MSIGPKRTTLDRFDGKNRSQGFEQTARQRSPESSFNSVKKPHLPRLKTPPEWPPLLQNDSDLKRGKLTVVPPVQTREAFVRKSPAQNSKQKNAAGSTNYFNQQQVPTTVFSGVPVVPYGQPVQSNNSVVGTNSAFPYPYPSGAYPVPVYISYAPLLPPIQNPTGLHHMGNSGYVVNKRFLTRDEAAISIQKHVRGWKVRKDCTLQKLQFLSQAHFARVFVDDFISEMLEEELVPDVLIEILSHKKSLSPHDPLYTMSNLICSDILNEDISYFLDLIAASVFYSQDKLVTLERPDPLINLCQDLINEVVNEMALVTVQSTIKSLVQSHMTFSKSVDWLEDFILETIQPMIYNVAITSHAGYKYEATLDDIIDDVTSEMMKSVIHEAWQDVSSDHCDKQTTEISKFSEGRLLDNLFVDHLLGHLSGNNLSLYITDYEEQTIDGLVCGVLLQQYMLVYDTNSSTLANKPVQKYHQDNYSNTAMDVIVDELCASLDEDMLDLLEKEKHPNV